MCYFLLKRYILYIPGGHEENIDSLSKTFELSITTSRKNREQPVDLLLHIVGSNPNYVSPLIWLRHSYEGLFRFSMILFRFYQMI